jgi:transcriptional regulator with XRE-family HTH domain
MEMNLEIKKARRAKGYTLDALAQLCGLSKGYLSKIERGVKVPSFATFQTIANALGVDDGELLRGGHINPVKAQHRGAQKLRRPDARATGSRCIPFRRF